MRTYSRKKVEYKMIEGVKERCRLCLGKSEEVVPIFTDGSEVCAALPMRIMICIGLEMVREDCLSNMICKNCHDELERYYSFRKKCEVTYQKLKAHVTFMKEQAVIAQHAKLKSELKEARDEGTEQRVEIQLQNENVEDRKLVLTFNEGDLQVVDVANWNGLAVAEKPEDLVNNHVLATQMKEQEQIIENEVQMQDITTTSQTPLVEAATEADMSTLITSILLRLGILSQEGELLEVVDRTFQEVELEAEDGERITLELVEEEDSPSITTSIVEECPEAEEPNTDDLRLVMETVEPPRPATHTQNQKPNIKITSKTTKTAEGKQAVGGGAWCAQCGKLYSSRSALARHARAHSAARPHACPRCGRGFGQKAVLARHMLVHEAERPFKCPSCPKSFTQRGALTSHARLHAPHARPLALHRCPRCPKLFLYASGLSRHMSVHEGRVFQCAECGRKFRDKSALTRHLKNADHKKHKPS